MEVTRDMGRDVRRESQTPARTDPILPCPDRPYRSTSRVETSHHIVTYVPATTHDAMVPATRKEWAA